MDYISQACTRYWVNFIRRFLVDSGRTMCSLDSLDSLNKFSGDLKRRARMNYDLMNYSHEGHRTILPGLKIARASLKMHL